MSTDHLHAFARYNQSMNQRLYAAADQLDDAARKQDRGAFFGSIHGTLNHILLVDRLWLGRITGRLYSVERLDQELYQEYAQLRQQQSAMDQRIIDWADHLDRAELDADFHYHDLAGKPWHGPLWVVVTQLFNHQTHHRGQITTLLHQAGIDVGGTDFPWVVQGLMQPADSN